MANTTPSFNPKSVIMKWTDQYNHEIDTYLPAYVFDNLSIDTHEVIDELWGPEIQDYVLVKLDEIVDILKQEHRFMLRQYRTLYLDAE